LKLLVIYFCATSSSETVMRDGAPNRIAMRCARGAQSRGLVDAATTLNVARCDKIRFRPRGAVWARRGAQPNQTDRAGQG